MIKIIGLEVWKDEGMEEVMLSCSPGRSGHRIETLVLKRRCHLLIDVIVFLGKTNPNDCLGSLAARVAEPVREVVGGPPPEPCLSDIGVDGSAECF